MERMKISLNEINWYWKRRCGFHWLGKWNENEERRFFFIIGKKLINGQDEDGCLHLFFDLNEENSRFQISNIRIVFWEIESWYCDYEGKQTKNAKSNTYRQAICDEFESDWFREEINSVKGGWSALYTTSSLRNRYRCNHHPCYYYDQFHRYFQVFYHPSRRE